MTQAKQVRYWRQVGFSKKACHRRYGSEFDRKIFADFLLRYIPGANYMLGIN